MADEDTISEKDITWLTYYTLRTFMLRYVENGGHDTFGGRYGIWCTGTLLFNVGPFAKDVKVGVLVKGSEVNLYVSGTWGTPTHQFQVPPKNPFAKLI